jgi:predicted HTH domain antitoxin
MNSLRVFSSRDLRHRSSDLVNPSSDGSLSVLTKHGKPTGITVPFDHRLLELGVEKDLALALFEAGTISLSKAAKFAGMTLDAFMDLLAAYDIPAVQYPASELDEELRVSL